MRMRVVALALLGTAALAVSPASAWFHAGNEGGHWHATYAGPGGVAHAGGTAGYGWHSSGVGYGGAYHAGGAAGYGWHGTAYGAAGYHGYGYNGYGYHQPVVVNHYYGGGCYNCGGWGAAAAGAAVGVAAGVAVGAAASSAATSNAYAAGYAAGSTYAALPGGCSYAPVNGVTYYACNGMWLQPAYGANGVFYRVVAAP